MHIFFLKAYTMPTDAMANTLKKGDYINCLKSWLTGKPKRGDIILFNIKQNGEDYQMVKRCVGIPGDIIEIKDNVLFINEQKFNEEYILLEQVSPEFANYGPKKVLEGYYFVLGDNRYNSHDSRYLGLIPEEAIMGKVFIRLWPIHKIRFIK